MSNLRTALVKSGRRPACSAGFYPLLARIPPAVLNCGNAALTPERQRNNLRSQGNLATVIHSHLCHACLPSRTPTQPLASPALALAGEYLLSYSYEETSPTSCIYPERWGTLPNDCIKCILETQEGRGEGVYEERLRATIRVIVLAQGR